MSVQVELFTIHVAFKCLHSTNHLSNRIIHWNRFQLLQLLIQKSYLQMCSRWHRAGVLVKVHNTILVAVALRTLNVSKNKAWKYLIWFQKQIIFLIEINLSANMNIEFATTYNEADVDGNEHKNVYGISPGC